MNLFFDSGLKGAHPSAATCTDVCPDRDGIDMAPTGGEAKGHSSGEAVSTSITVDQGIQRCDRVVPPSRDQPTSGGSFRGDLECRRRETQRSLQLFVRIEAASDQGVKCDLSISECSLAQTWCCCQNVSLSRQYKGRGIRCSDKDPVRVAQPLPWQWIRRFRLQSGANHGDGSVSAWTHHADPLSCRTIPPGDMDPDTEIVEAIQAASPNVIPAQGSEKVNLRSAESSHLHSCNSASTADVIQPIEGVADTSGLRQLIDLQKGHPLHMADNGQREA